MVKCFVLCIQHTAAKYPKQAKHFWIKGDLKDITTKKKNDMAIFVLVGLVWILYMEVH